MRLNKARDRAWMRGHAGTQVEIHLVDIAPAPSLGWIIAFDDRMSSRMEMLGGMTIWRFVAAADMAAGATQSQMHPPRTDLQTFLAPVGARGNVRNRMIVGTRVGHGRRVDQGVVRSTG